MTNDSTLNHPTNISGLMAKVDTETEKKTLSTSKQTFKLTRTYWSHDRTSMTDRRGQGSPALPRRHRKLFHYNSIYLHFFKLLFWC